MSFTDLDAATCKASWTELWLQARAQIRVGGRPTLLTYSDGSQKGQGQAATATYAWHIAGLAGCDFHPHLLVRGSGLVHGEPADITSTRAERLGAIATITG